MSLILTTLSAAALLMPQGPDSSVTEASAAKPQSEVWMTDFAAAQALAAKEGKDLLVDFTGSDWCSWCIKLDEEVFDQQAFLDEASQKFVFVKLDFPRRKEQSAEIKKQNQELQQRFGVQGFPTILLCDAEGMPFAKTGYQPDGPEAYLSHLAELGEAKTARDEGMARAAAAEGAERAEILAEVIEALPPELHAQYRGLMEEIAKLGDDELKAEYEGRLKQLDLVAARQQLDGRINELAMAENWAGAVTAIEEFLAANEGVLDTLGTQEMHLLIAMLRHRDGDVRGAIDAMKAGLAIDPNSPIAPNFEQGIEKLTEMLEAEAGQAEAGDGY